VRLLHASHRPRDLYLARALIQAGHVVETLDSLGDAAVASAGEDYDAVLLEVADLADAPLAALSRCAERAILVLIADHASSAARAAALRGGADACLIRPVHVVELEARLTALVRLAPALGAHAARTALRFDAASRTVSLDGRVLALPSREYALLAYVADHAGEVLTAEQILKHVWGEGDDPRPERVRTAVARLRLKLEAAFGRPLLVTLRGHGYRLDANMTGFSSG
jgi:DNA-binding response OmpR family regulator